MKTDRETDSRTSLGGAFSGEFLRREWRRFLKPGSVKSPIAVVLAVALGLGALIYAGSQAKEDTAHLLLLALLTLTNLGPAAVSVIHLASWWYKRDRLQTMFDLYLTPAGVTPFLVSRMLPPAVFLLGGALIVPVAGHLLLAPERPSPLLVGSTALFTFDAVIAAVFAYPIVMGFLMRREPFTLPAVQAFFLLLAFSMPGMMFAGSFLMRFGLVKELDLVLGSGFILAAAGKLVAGACSIRRWRRDLAIANEQLLSWYG